MSEGNKSDRTWVTLKQTCLNLWKWLWSQLGTEIQLRSFVPDSQWKERLAHSKQKNPTTTHSGKTFQNSFHIPQNHTLPFITTIQSKHDTVMCWDGNNDVFKLKRNVGSHFKSHKHSHHIKHMLQPLTMSTTQHTNSPKQITLTWKMFNFHIFLFMDEAENKFWQYLQLLPLFLYEFLWGFDAHLAVVGLKCPTTVDGSHVERDPSANPVVKYMIHSFPVRKFNIFKICQDYESCAVCRTAVASCLASCSACCQGDSFSASLLEWIYYFINIECLNHQSPLHFYHGG